MAKNTKKITTANIEKAAGKIINTNTVEWNGLSITIKRNLSLDDMRKFVDNVAQSCFTQQDEAYHPELKEYAVRSMVIMLYTNIELDMPADLDKLYDLLYTTDLWHVIVNNIDAEQFNQMLNAVDRRIDYIIATSVSAINRQIAEIQEAIEDVMPKLKAMFNEVSADDVKNLVSAITNTNIDEEKLMKAYLLNRR